MPDATSYKRRVLGLFSLLSLSIAGMIYSFISISVSTQHAMEEIYIVHSKPIAELTASITELIDIRYRMLAYVADILPAPSCLDNLRRSRKKYLVALTTYQESMKAAKVSKNSRDVLSLIPKGVESAEAIFNDLEKKYENQNEDGVTEIIEEKWPLIQSDLVDPLRLLYRSHEAAIFDLNSRS